MASIILHFCQKLRFRVPSYNTRWGKIGPKGFDFTKLWPWAVQELYLWESVATAARTALGLRYALLSYISTAFRKSSKTGIPVAQPLWLAFPEDNATHAIDQQWLLGSDILISPVLYEVLEKNGQRECSLQVLSNRNSSAVFLPYFLSESWFCKQFREVTQETTLLDIKFADARDGKAARNRQMRGRSQDINF